LEIGAFAETLVCPVILFDAPEMTTGILTLMETLRSGQTKGRSRALLLPRAFNHSML